MLALGTGSQLSLECCPLEQAGAGKREKKKNQPGNGLARVKVYLLQKGVALIQLYLS